MERKHHYFTVAIAMLLILGITLTTQVSLADGRMPIQQLTPTPMFRYPLFRDPNRMIEISGWFDHKHSHGVGVIDQFVTFFDGRESTSGNGFWFNCPELMPAPDWVGCLDTVAGEENCPNSKELWYDAHRGTDYEYEIDWHTGNSCDLDRFSNRQPVPVFAPARGRVYLVQKNHPANGNAVWLMHDLNGNGDFTDDTLVSIYLHLDSIESPIREGEMVGMGQLLGYGGMTGLAFTPHLHFQVNRSSSPGFTGTKWEVDPFGWSGDGSDPWPHENRWLWFIPTYLPFVVRR